MWKRSSIYFLVLVSLGLSSCRLTANFYEVDPGKFYRSAQLTGEEFQKAIDHFGIRTIVNLRGASNASWYQEERAVAQKNGVELFDISMSATRLPHREDLIALLDVLRDAERPILIHCKAGADRTGEAAAIYQMLYMGKSVNKAKKMLSPKYLHLKMFTPAKDYFIENLWAGEVWAREIYDPCTDGRTYKYYDKSKNCKPDGTPVDVLELTPEEDT